MRRRPLLRCFALTASLAALAVSMSASPAPASVTIGQLADPSAGNCDPGVDFVQLSATSGNQYVVPGTGTITSWTTQTGADGGALALKVFRKEADPASFQVVGHTARQSLTPGGTAGNTFPANIRVSPGDLLGLHTPSPSPCGFKDPGGLHASFSGDLADGEVAGFVPEPDFDLDVQAVFVPDNNFSIGHARLNKRKGAATLAVNVPNPGELALSGKGIRVGAAKRISAAGEAELLIKGKGRTMRKLQKSGKAGVTVTITYIPTGGDPRTRSTVLKLAKR
jgi:hypothetical protein